MFYVFHGDDIQAQKETLTKLIAKLGDVSMLDINTTRFTGTMPFNELRQACDSIPFLAKARIIIVTDFIQSKPDKALMGEILDYLPRLPETTRLIFQESKVLRDNNALLKLARQEKNGFEKLFSRPQGSQLERWIIQRAETKNGRIAPQAAHLLATSIGNELDILDNELEKLVAYKGQDEDPLIHVGDVALLSPYVTEASIFDLVDAIGNRNGKNASRLLQEKFSQGADPFYLFSMFVRQFRLLIQVKELVVAGYRPAGIARELNLHNFVVTKLYQQVRGYTLQELEQVYEHLLDIDIAVKTGQGDMKTSLDLLVANLTLIA
ncbi:MAG: DNA polymerase III subunit delta [Candidatus Promineifilaceae bacterium]|nr:DNA polymerase III subunit delta [Candidatus Promineifilaceae bacterium]